MANGDITERTVKRKDGTTYLLYQGEYRDRDGKRAFVSDKKKREAQKKLRDAIGEVETWRHAKGSETLGQVIDEFVYAREKAQRRGDIRNGTLQSQKCSLSLVPKKLLAMKLASFKDEGEIKEALDALRSRYAVRTVRKVKSTLCLVFDFARDPPQRYVPRNVMRDNIRKLRGPKAPKRKNAATPQDAVLALRAARAILDDRVEGRSKSKRVNLLVAANVYASLCFTLQTGLRSSETFGLQVTDVRRFDSPPPDRPHIWGEATIRHTQTVHDRFAERTKNEEVRVVQFGRLVVEAFDIVERYWRAHGLAAVPGHQCATAYSKRVDRRFARLGGAPRPRGPDALAGLERAPERRQHGYMFVGKYGNPYDANSISHHVREVMREAGLVQRDGAGRIIIGVDGKPKPKFSLYSFRHMVATFNAGRLPAHIGAAQTGHTVGTFLNEYVHQSSEDQARAAQAVAELEAELAPVATNLRQKLITG